MSHGEVVIAEAYEHVPREDDNLSSRQKIHALASKAKWRTKSLLGIDHEPDEQEEVERRPEDVALASLGESPAFNPEVLIDEQRVGGKTLRAKATDALRITADAIVHPKQALKARATKTVSDEINRGAPAISRNADLDFLDAYRDLHDAKNTDTESDEGLDEREAKAVKEEKVQRLGAAVDDLEERREGMRVAWLTERHIQRVKVVHKEAGQFPPDAFFEAKDDYGKTEYLWGKWLAWMALYYSHPFTAKYVDDFDGELSYSVETLRRHVERLVVVSGPFQEGLAAIRKIYTWDDPAKTGTWMLVFWSMWYLSHVGTFVFGYITYCTLMNHFYPTSLDDLRDSIERSLDRSSSALRIGELIDKHGQSNWIEPLAEEFGPIIQMQLYDLANLLEVLYNFYHWKSPAKTQASLFLFSTVTLICLLGSARFCLKVMYFIVGGSFFFCFPIATNFPKYRMLVSPTKWIFWDVPTHAEYSFQYLQEHSVPVLKALEAKSNRFTGTEDLGPVTADRFGLHVQPEERSDSDVECVHVAETSNEAPSSKRAVDILSFRCIYQKCLGHLIISSVGLRFRASAARTAPRELTDFSIPFQQLDEMRKCASKAAVLGAKTGLTAGRVRLELRIRDEVATNEHMMNRKLRTTKILLEGMKTADRDRAFNAILGFSGEIWQNLQNGWND